MRLSFLNQTEEREYSVTAQRHVPLAQQKVLTPTQKNLLLGPKMPTPRPPCEKVDTPLQTGRDPLMCCVLGNGVPRPPRPAEGLDAGLGCRVEFGFGGMGFECGFPTQALHPKSYTSKPTPHTSKPFTSRPVMAWSVGLGPGVQGLDAGLGMSV